MESTKKINKLRLNQETLRNITDLGPGNDLINSHQGGCSINSVCGLPCTP